MASFLGISLLLVFFLSCPSWSMADGNIGKPGGRTEVKDVKHNKEVQDLGRFSVKEYNKNPSYYRQGHGAEGPLQFKEVVKAETQVVAGVKYYLTISVSQGGVPKTYDAVVVVKPWVHQSKQLLTFTPSTN